ncbi:MAG: hypothetical protein DRJ61_09350 [Acidobacteria bacterium]|nr:MAG: hypothetical protein DRJ61_09350 [Acidobacteriota bacterium]
MVCFKSWGEGSGIRGQVSGDRDQGLGIRGRGTVGNGNGLGHGSVRRTLPVFRGMKRTGPVSSVDRWIIATIPRSGSFTSSAVGVTQF